MGGLEEILKQIKEESEAEIAEILGDAQRECDKIKSDSVKEINNLMEIKNRQLETDTKLTLEKLQSGAMTKQRQEILRIKQKMIFEILEKTQAVLINLDAEQYFKILFKIAENNAHEESGVMYLNDRDLKRVPDSFVEKLKSKGINLKISDKPVEIMGGMILGYGDVEENCTFKALINGKKEILQDKINDYLFS